MAGLHKDRRFSWRSGLDLLASVGMIVVAGVLLINGRAFRVSAPPRTLSVKLPSEPLPLDGLATKGSRQSQVGLIVYSDFECPFCRRFAVDVLPVLERELIDRDLLLFAFKHLPLESIHPQALAAATLAECGNRNGDFWKIHDRLFAATAISQALIETLAAEANLTRDSSCMTSEGAAVVRQHQKEAEGLGITGTPTLLLGRLQTDGRLLVKKILTGVQSAEAIASAVNALRAADK